MTFRVTKLAQAQQHDVHISYTELLLHRATNVESTERSSFTYIRYYIVAFTGPIFSKVTTTRQMFVDIFCTELYPSWKENVAKKTKKNYVLPSVRYGLSASRSPRNSRLLNKFL